MLLDFLDKAIFDKLLKLCWPFVLIFQSRWFITTLIYMQIRLLKPFFTLLKTWNNKNNNNNNNNLLRDLSVLNLQVSFDIRKRALIGWRSNIGGCSSASSKGQLVNQFEIFQRILAEYDLFKTTISIQNCIYMNFLINLSQFTSISRDRNIRYNFHGSQSKAKVKCFQPIHLSFFP